MDVVDRPAVSPLAVFSAGLRGSLRLPVALILGLLLLAVGGALLNNQVATWLLRVDAESTARNWAADLNNVLGEELPALLARNPPSPQTQLVLQQARQVGDVFRYKLFDARGSLVFVSDDLNRPEGLEATLSAHRGSSAIAGRILGGSVHVEAARGEPPTRPAYYSEAYVPIHQGGKIIGVVEVYVNQTEKQLRYEQAFLVTEIGVVALVLLAGAVPGMLAWRRSSERRAADERARFLATHDALTGLPNRRCLNEALREASRLEGGCALFMLDLDRFKPVNDLHGHLAGDRLLQEVAGRLRGAVRSTDIVARLGGDEFAVILNLDGGGPEVAARLASRVVAAVALPFEHHGAVLQVGSSIGIALSPQDATNAQELLRRADLALYRAKAEGRGCFRFFEAGMDALARHRAGLETDLRAAVRDDLLVPHFQPLVELTTGRLIGFEMLARWTHPVRGAVAPSEFIPIAEDTGLIVLLTERLLRNACCVAAEWPEHLTLAVNISPLQLRDRALPLVIRAVLQDTGFPASRLEVEITESALIGNLTLAREIMEQLKALGVRLSLDDFGTGYSSLAHLQALPFDKIKIDASFVNAMATDASSRKIVAAVVGLGHNLGLPTVAEGVEELSQADVLRHLGCDIGQGWLFGRALPAKEASDIASAAIDDRLRSEKKPSVHI